MHFFMLAGAKVSELRGGGVIGDVCAHWPLSSPPTPWYVVLCTWHADVKLTVVLGEDVESHGRITSRGVLATAAGASLGQATGCTGAAANARGRGLDAGAAQSGSTAEGSVAGASGADAVRRVGGNGAAA